VVDVSIKKNGRDRSSNVADAGYDRREILQAVRSHLANGKYPRSTLYGDGRAGEHIAELLARVPLTIEKRITY